MRRFVRTKTKFLDWRNVAKRRIAAVRRCREQSERQDEQREPRRVQHRASGASDGAERPRRI